MPKITNTSNSKNYHTNEQAAGALGSREVVEPLYNPRDSQSVKNFLSKRKKVLKSENTLLERTIQEFITFLEDTKVPLDHQLKASRIAIKFSHEPLRTLAKKTLVNIITKKSENQLRYDDAFTALIALGKEGWLALAEGSRFGTLEYAAAIDAVMSLGKEGWLTIVNNNVFQLSDRLKAAKNLINLEDPNARKIGKIALLDILKSNKRQDRSYLKALQNLLGLAQCPIRKQIIKAILKIVKDSSTNSSYRNELIEALIHSGKQGCLALMQDPGIINFHRIRAANYLLVSKSTAPQDKAKSKAFLLGLIQDNPLNKEAVEAIIYLGNKEDWVALVSNTAIPYIHRIKAANNLTDLEDEQAQNIGKIFLLEAVNYTSVDILTHKTTAKSLITLNDNQARSKGISILLNIVKNPAIDFALHRWDAAAALLTISHEYAGAEQAEAFLYIITDSSVYRAHRFHAIEILTASKHTYARKALQAIAKDMNLGSTYMAKAAQGLISLGDTSILEYYDNSLDFVSESPEKMKVIHKKYAQVVMQLIAEEEDPLRQKALIRLTLLSEEAADSNLYFRAYSIYGRSLMLSKEKSEFVFDIEVNSTLKARIVPQKLFKPKAFTLTDEQKKITHKDFINLFQNLFKEAEGSPQKSESFAKLLAKSKLTYKGIENKINEEIVKYWFKEGGTLNAIQSIARLNIDFIRKYDATHQENELSSQAHQTLLLLERMATCTGGQEQGMRTYYNEQIQINSITGLTPLALTDIESLRQQQFNESLETWREVHILTYIEQMLNGQEEETNTFLEEVTETKGIFNLITGTPHEAKYLRNVIGLEIGARPLSSQLSFDPHSGGMQQALLTKNKQEILDIFKKHFLRKFSIKSLSQSLAAFLNEQIKSHSTKVPSASTSSPRQQYEGLLQGIFTPDEIANSSDEGWFIGSFDDDTLFTWKQIESVTTKGAEAIMRKLGWVETA